MTPHALYMWHDASTRVTWRIHVWLDPFKMVAVVMLCFIRIYNMTHSHVWHYSFVYWTLYTDSGLLFIFYDCVCMISVTEFIGEISLTHLCGMTHFQYGMTNFHYVICMHGYLGAYKWIFVCRTHTYQNIHEYAYKYMNPIIMSYIHCIQIEVFFAYTSHLVYM